MLEFSLIMAGIVVVLARVVLLVVSIMSLYPLLHMSIPFI
jgi:hypothetical protein